MAIAEDDVEPVGHAEGMDLLRLLEYQRLGAGEPRAPDETSDPFTVGPGERGGLRQNLTFGLDQDAAHGMSLETEALYGRL